MTNQASVRTAVPRLGGYKGPAILRYGFRPFFLAAAVWAIVTVTVWIGILHGAIHLPIASAPLDWHIHEMLFGYLVAAVAGFLLTAIPNWTGKLPLRGWPLAGLALLWLAGRIASSMSAILGPPLTALIDLSFLCILALVVLREIASGKNWRNLPMVAALLALLVANALTHLGPASELAREEIGQRLGIATIALLIGLIGGRIIPSFTSNWLKKRAAKPLPRPFDGVDRFALLVTLASLAAWTAAPQTLLTGLLMFVAAIANAYRLSRWRPSAVLTEPLLVVLHLGYLWLPIGFLLTGLAAFGAITSSAGVHALTVGAMGTMTLAVMTRATLGHTGRELMATPSTTAVFAMITVAAAARVLAALMPVYAAIFQSIASLLWIGAFATFLLVYGPMLVRPARPGLRT